MRYVGRVWRVAVGVIAVVLMGACDPDADMPETMEMPDTMDVVRAMHDETVMDSLMDVMPGGEMARGDSAASMKLLKMKMEAGGS